MPTYEYECSKCGYVFELFQNMSDAPRKRCPKCRGSVKRLVGTGAGIIFKGSGFYQTDYRSSSYREAESKEKEQPKTTPKAENKKKEKKNNKTAGGGDL